MTWTDRLLALAVVLLLAAAGAVADVTFVDTNTCGPVLNRAASTYEDGTCEGIIDGRLAYALQLLAVALVALLLAAALIPRSRRALSDPVDPDEPLEPEGPASRALALLGLAVPVPLYAVLAPSGAGGGAYTDLLDEHLAAATATGVLLMAMAASASGLGWSWSLAAASVALPLTWGAIYANDLGAREVLAADTGDHLGIALVLSGIPLSAALALAWGMRRAGLSRPSRAVSWSCLLLSCVVAAVVITFGATAGLDPPHRGVAVALLSAPALLGGCALLACSRRRRAVHAG